jgi:hypothetical protein
VVASAARLAMQCVAPSGVRRAVRAAASARRAAAEASAAMVVGVRAGLSGPRSVALGGVEDTARMAVVPSVVGKGPGRVVPLGRRSAVHSAVRRMAVGQYVVRIMPTWGVVPLGRRSAVQAVAVRRMAAPVRAVRIKGRRRAAPPGRRSAAQAALSARRMVAPPPAARLARRHVALPGRRSAAGVAGAPTGYAVSARQIAGRRAARVWTPLSDRAQYRAAPGEASRNGLTPRVSPLPFLSISGNGGPLVGFGLDAFVYPARALATDDDST